VDPYTADLDFAFFANPNNLPVLMPAFLRMRIDNIDLVAPPPNLMIAGQQLTPQEISAGMGTQIEMSFRPVSYLPVRVSWVARISEFVCFSYFCDEQIKGPSNTFDICTESDRKWNSHCLWRPSGIFVTERYCGR
jgi:ligand-binding SRPBCC domain-containing protein